MPMPQTTMRYVPVPWHLLVSSTQLTVSCDTPTPALVGKPCSTPLLKWISSGGFELVHVVLPLPPVVMIAALYSSPTFPRSSGDGFGKSVSGQTSRISGCTPAHRCESVATTVKGKCPAPGIPDSTGGDSPGGRDPVSTAN